MLNFLSALALVNNGVREILPFVRYIAQFVDFEFTSIRGQDQGKGVVCAATWCVAFVHYTVRDKHETRSDTSFCRIMPAAMVPRPWDFPDPPVSFGFQGQTVDSPTEDNSIGIGPGGVFSVAAVSSVAAESSSQ